MTGETTLSVVVIAAAVLLSIVLLFDRRRRGRDLAAMRHVAREVFMNRLAVNARHAQVTALALQLVQLAQLVRADRPAPVPWPTQRRSADPTWPFPITDDTVQIVFRPEEESSPARCGTPGCPCMRDAGRQGDAADALDLAGRDGEQETAAAE